MKNIFKTMLPILAMAACVWTSCSDDKDKNDPTPEKPALPTITVSEPALSADNTKAVVTVTPSDDTENGTGSANRKANLLPHIRL